MGEREGGKVWGGRLGWKRSLTRSFEYAQIFDLFVIPRYFTPLR